MKSVKLSVAAVCLILAALIFWWTYTPSEAQLADPETSTNWMCAGCRAVVALTVAEAQRAEEAAGGLPLICDECRKKDVYRAALCDQCGSYYFSSDVPGSLGRCPTCFPPGSRDIPPPPPVLDESGEPAPPSV